MITKNKPNYQRQLDALIEGLESAPTLLLHSCCAPCSSYTLEYLSRYFRITVLYFNPNIMRREEYEKRVEEQRRLIAELPAHHPITFVEGRYDPREFIAAAKGLEQEPEGGRRCRECYRLRLEETARLAASGVQSAECRVQSVDLVQSAECRVQSVDLVQSAECRVQSATARPNSALCTLHSALNNGRPFDYFCTTLSISPLKNAEWLNEIGEEMARKYGVRWLPSDFKKRGGYKRSIELSKEYGLYRQNFCGCEYSKKAQSPL